MKENCNVKYKRNCSRISLYLRSGALRNKLFILVRYALHRLTNSRAFLAKSFLEAHWEKIFCCRALRDRFASRCLLLFNAFYFVLEAYGEILLSTLSRSFCALRFTNRLLHGALRNSCTHSVCVKLFIKR